MANDKAVEPAQTPIPMFDPAEHESLSDEEWDENAARAFVARTVREADDAFDPAHGWPLHPEDRDADETQSVRGVNNGSAGTMWALVRLAARYDVALRNDYATAIARCEEAYRADPFETETVVPSFSMGTVGIMLARYTITGERAILERIESDMRANADNPTREVLWGSPGTAVAGLLLRERDGEERFDGVLSAVHDELWATWEAPDADGGLLWEQDMYGQRSYFTGAGHGAVGPNLGVLIRAADLLSPERKEILFERVPALLETYALREGDALNWHALGAPCRGNRMQWCHGAPGVITGLAAYPATDARVEELLIAGGEGIWRAGPLRKGPTICHGTAGNGFAFLRLAERAGDERWHDRAERFAMHSMAQVHAWRETFGMPSFSLWTDDLGVALYVDAVLRRDPAMLTADVM